MTGPEELDALVFRRIARRVEDILEAARDREGKGQTLALDIDARLRMEDVAAVQFQLASAILEEAGGLRQEEVVGELLSLGLATVLRGAAKAIGSGNLGSELRGISMDGSGDNLLEGMLSGGPTILSANRVIN